MKTDQTTMYDISWRKAICQGKESFGDTEVQYRAIQLLCSGKGQRVLEIGCGTGRLVDYLSRCGFNVSGIDIAPSAILWGLSFFPYRDLRIASATATSFPDNAFDVVVSFDLIEHLQSVDLHIEEVKRVLKPGGIYFLKTPHKLSNIIFETLKSQSLKWREYHPSLQYPGRLRKLLEHHGFSVEFIKVDIRSRYLTKKIGRLLGRFDFRFLPQWFQPNLFIIARYMA